MGFVGSVRRALAIPMLLAAAAPAAPAWDEAVHRAVARVAHERLTPEAERRHRLLMGVGAKLEDVAGWADEIIPERPETEAWHSITIPPDATEIDLDRDCPVGDCAPVKVRECVGIVRLAHKSKPEIREAFQFLVNLAADMHNPLNAGYPPGGGGDVMQVVLDGRPMTLHEAWNGALLGTADVDELADRIRGYITAESAREWSAGTIKGWTWETHLTAVRVAYSGLPDGDSKPLDEEYVRQARGAAELQLAKAAVRLAALLNETWLQ